MNCDNATKSNRKSGVAQWRDLLFSFNRLTSARWWRRLPFVIPSEAEGSAVFLRSQPRSTGQQSLTGVDFQIEHGSQNR
jgi:hypothetical protein